MGIRIIQSVLYNVLDALYHAFSFSLLLAFLYMFFYLFAKDSSGSGKGFKTALLTWWQQFRCSVLFRRTFYLAFYSAMILFRTLLNRYLWENPLSEIMGGWWIHEPNPYTGNLEFTTEGIENLILFIPFSWLLLWHCERHENLVKKLENVKCILFATKMVFLFSLTIELLQVFLRVGTFQIADLVYNTFGGFIGAWAYWVYRKYKKGRII